VEEGNSLATQERNCREYAAKHGFVVVATFIEQGESAKTADRTELKKLIAFCTAKKNSVNAVILYKIDRLSRNTDDYSHIRAMLKKNNVEIRSTSENFEDNPAGRFMENIIANVAQFDNDVRAERCKGGMHDAVREGRYVWMAPYGYSNVRVNGKATIAPNEYAHFVKKTFEEVAKQQFPIVQIHKKLIAVGMITKTGKPIAQSYLYTLLKNELYVGWIHKFGERRKGTFEPIISEGLFNTVQYILTGKRNAYPLRQRENVDFPLKRFFRHPTGIAMTGCWSQGRHKKYPYYLIHGHNINIRKELLESVFKTWLDDYKLDIEYFEKLSAFVKERTRSNVALTKVEKENVQKEIESLKIKQALILDKNLQGIISDDLCKEHIAKMESTIYELNEKLNAVPESTIDYTHLLNISRNVLLNPGEAWEKATIEEKIKLQWFYFPHGIEFDGNESRTAKICKLFKQKSKILGYYSFNVHSENKTSNTANWQILRIPESTNASDSSPPLLVDVGEELTKLAAIIQDTPPPS
jgi:site-specific DNA recombinase